MEALFQMLAQMVLSQLMAAFLFSLQKVKGPGTSELKNKDIPTAKNSEPISTFFGTIMFKGGNVLWFGDKSTSEIREEVFNNFIGKFLDIGSEVVKGYKYYLSIFIGIGFSIDNTPMKLKRIRIVDTDVYTNSGLTTGSGSISKNKLFNDASDIDNGWSGTFYWYDGTQVTPSSILESKLGVGEVPPYKDLCSIIFDKNYIGNSPRLEKLSFEIEHMPIPSWGNSTHARIGTSDYNPIYALYFLLTDGNIGCDIHPSLIDEANFNAIAQTLYDEDIGISMEISQGITYDSVKTTFEDIIDGFIDVSHTDGKYRIKLNRQDYDINTIPVLDESEISSFTMQTTSSESLLTEYRVLFDNRSKEYEEDVAVFSDLGTRYNRGSMKTGTTEYKWIKDKNLATKIAARDLKPLSYPLTKAKIKVSQKFTELARGDVVKVNYPRYNIYNLIFRIGSVDYGNFDNNSITLDCAEDLFGFFESSYLPPADSKYNEPDVLATTTNLTIVEAPFYFNDSYTTSTLFSFGERANTGQINYELQAEDSSNVFGVEQSVVLFTPYGDLSANIGHFDTSFNVDNGALMENMSNLTSTEIKLGGNIAYIKDGVNSEWIGFETVTDNGGGNYTLGSVKRSLFHTSTKPHSAGAKIYFPSYGLGQLARQIPNGENVGSKALTRSFKDKLAFGSAPTVNYTATLVQNKNLPVLSVRLNSNAAPTSLPNSIFGIEWSFQQKIYENIDIFYGQTKFHNGTDVCNVKVYEDGVLKLNTDITDVFTTYTPTTSPANIRIVLTNVTGSSPDSEPFDITLPVV